MLKNVKRTKIVCTLGPASDSEEVLTKLVENGLNVCRFNFSHGCLLYTSDAADE